VRGIKMKLKKHEMIIIEEAFVGDVWESMDGNYIVQKSFDTKKIVETFRNLTSTKALGRDVLAVHFYKWLINEGFIKKVSNNVEFFTWKSHNKKGLYLQISRDDDIIEKISIHDGEYLYDSEGFII
jgi:hypothetical protein